MSNTKTFEEWGTICQNKALTSEELEEIINSVEGTESAIHISYIESLIASHPNVSVETLRILFEKRDPLVLASILANPKTPKNWYKEIDFSSKTSYSVDLDKILN